MACQLFRTDGKVEKVLAPNEKPSLLYSEILTVVKKEGSKKFIDSIPYLRDRLEDGTLLNESSEEIAVGIWSIAYSPEYQAFFNNLNKKLNVFSTTTYRDQKSLGGGVFNSEYFNGDLPSSFANETREANSARTTSVLTFIKVSAFAFRQMSLQPDQDRQYLKVLGNP